MLSALQTELNVLWYHGICIPKIQKIKIIKIKIIAIVVFYSFIWMRTQNDYNHGLCKTQDQHDVIILIPLDL